jgi:TRAP-type C4-dicarboxylate transport system permease small subunit
MSEPLASATEALAYGPVGRVLRTLCRVFAITGSLVFVAIVLMSVVSLSGRKLWSTPIAGDVEMLQMCAAFAAASFFAWCHLSGSDVKVDFFTARMSARSVHAMDAFGSLLVALFGVVLAWRTGQGAWMVKEAGEQSMLMEWPLWIPQMAMVPGFALLAWAALYRVQQHLSAAINRGARTCDHAGDAA